MSNQIEVDDALRARLRADPELAAKMAALLEDHEEPVPAEVDQYPRYVFGRDLSGRKVGDSVKVRNGLDEEIPGGKILAKVGRAYRVEIQSFGITVIVHEPDDSWQ